MAKNIEANVISDAVEGVASFFGLGPAYRSVVRQINDWMYKQGATKDKNWILDSAYVIKQVQDAVSKLRLKNTSALNYLENLISALPSSMSSTIKPLIQNKKKELSKKYAKEREKTEKINAIENYGNQSAYSVDNSLISVGNKQAQDIIDDVNKMAKTVEETV